jgi:SNF2 family DNA or RNA helicase
MHLLTLFQFNLDSDLPIRIKPEVVLRTWQQSGIQMMAEILNRFHAVFNCDDMGLGKTLTTLTTIAQLKLFPILIVTADMLLVENWGCEIVHFVGMVNSLAISVSDQLFTINIERTSVHVCPTSRVLHTLCPDRCTAVITIITVYALGAEQVQKPISGYIADYRFLCRI